jgi:hypothetical protein
VGRDVAAAERWSAYGCHRGGNGICCFLWMETSVGLDSGVIVGSGVLTSLLTEMYYSERCLRRHFCGTALVIQEALTTSPRTFK